MSAFRQADRSFERSRDHDSDVVSSVNVGDERTEEFPALTRTMFVKYAGASATSTRCTTTTRSRPRSGTRRCSGTGCSRWASRPGWSRTGSGRRRSAGSRCGSRSRCGRATCSRARRWSPASARRAASTSSTSTSRSRTRTASRRSPARRPRRSALDGAARRSRRDRHRLGRGIGREFALCFAREGAQVVVNDVGVSLDGRGTEEDPAAQVCKEIEALGGEGGAELRLGHRLRRRARNIVQTAVDAFGTRRHPRQQRGHRARQDAAQDGRGRLRRGRSRCT